MKKRKWLETGRGAAIAGGLLLLAVSCQSRRTGPVTAAPPQSAAAPAQGASSTSSTAAPLPDDSVPAIARREVIRRQEHIRRMDEAALRASQALAEDDLEGAVSGFRKAVDGVQ